MNITKLGLFGEWKAERYLKKKGMRILQRRYHTPHGEIDLIAKEDSLLVFVEVKYRPSGQMGDGLHAIDAQKQKRLRYAARHYLQLKGQQPVRFDAVEITASGIRHIPHVM